MRHHLILRVITKLLVGTIFLFALDYDRECLNIPAVPLAQEHSRQRSIRAILK